MKPSPRDAAVRRLQAAIGHTFADPALLDRALTHRSFSSCHNERFEFVGDAILNYTSPACCSTPIPSCPKAPLPPARQPRQPNRAGRNRRRAQYRRRAAFGRGRTQKRRFQTAFHPRRRDGGGVCRRILRRGFCRAEAVVRRLFAERVQTIDCGEKEAKDAKTRLQEALQAQRFALPKYRIDKQEGEGSGAWFTVSCDLGELGFVSTAQAAGRRAAEQEAAKTALEWFAAKYPAAGAKHRRR